MRQITAAHVSPAFAPISRSSDFLKIPPTRFLAATRDSFGDPFDDDIHSYLHSAD